MGSENGKAKEEEKNLPTQQYPKDFDDPKREANARLVPFFEDGLRETVDSLQEEAAINQMTLSDGTSVRVGPKLLQDIIVDVERRSGVIAETDDQGNVHVQATFPERDKRGLTRRTSFYTGAAVEAVTMDSAFASADLREKGREPKDLTVKNRVMEIAKNTAEEAQKKGEEIDRKIINENYKFLPQRFQPAIITSVRRETEIALDPNLIGQLTSRAYSRIREQGGRSIDQVKVQLARFTEHNILVRARGTMVDQIIPRTSLTIMVKTSKGSEAYGSIRGSCGSLEQCLRRYLKPDENDDLFAVIDKLCHQVLHEASDLDRAEGVGILGSRCPVIFAPQVTGVFAHECFGHAAEGDIIYENMKDQSAQIKLKSRLGSQVSEFTRFTLIDTPESELKIDGQIIHRFNWGAFDVDRYGESAKVCIIVENGNMVEAMTDMFTHEYVIEGIQSVIERMNQRGVSGSSRRESYSVRPQIRMRNTFILPDSQGPSTKEEMAAKYQEFKVKKGVYVKSCKGGWVDTRNGTFNVTGNLSYLIENGMVTNKPVKDVNITGKLGDIPAMIGGLGNVKSMHHTFTGFCGKNNQWVPVDGGGPCYF